MTAPITGPLDSGKQATVVMVFNRFVDVDGIAKDCGLEYAEGERWIGRFVTQIHLQKFDINPVPFKLLRVRVNIDIHGVCRIPTEWKSYARAIFIERLDRMEQIKNAELPDETEQRLWQLAPLLPLYPGPLWNSTAFK